MYSDQEAAALYSVLNPWGPSDDFYLDLVMAARAVLDVGCGTGTLLHRARRAGHAGRLCGVDPDAAMLAVARGRTDIEWQAGTAAAMTGSREFDLAIMTGHAFQFLIGDGELRASLSAIRDALADGGRFAFETRNPLARAWESWNPRHPIDVVDPAGRRLRVSYQVEAVVGDVVTLTETTSDREGTPLRVDRASLRFLDVDTLAAFLSGAGFRIEAQYGDWSRAPLTRTSPEIITIARTQRCRGRSRIPAILTRSGAAPEQRIEAAPG
jgi:SAM-dependent methyltransferase